MGGRQHCLSYIPIIRLWHSVMPVQSLFPPWYSSCNTLSSLMQVLIHHHSLCGVQSSWGLTSILMYQYYPSRQLPPLLVIESLNHQSNVRFLFFTCDPAQSDIALSIKKGVTFVKSPSFCLITKYLVSRAIVAAYVLLLMSYCFFVQWISASRRQVFRTRVFTVPKNP